MVRRRFHGWVLLAMSLAVTAACAPPALATTTTVAGAGTISIPTGPGNATPYPSTQIAGPPGNPPIQGQITDVAVNLLTFGHFSPNDVGMVLTGPGGQSIELMDCVGDSTDVFGRDITFSDSGATQLPNFGAWDSGTYRPTNHCDPLRLFPAPGPGTNYANPGPAGGGSATLRGTFAGTEPEGAWSLFVRDFVAGDGGGAIGTWHLVITTPDPPDTQITSSPKKKTRKKKATFGFTAVPSPTVRQPATFECSLDFEPPSPCTSPKTYRVKKGKHDFAVRATIDGVQDQSVATYKWRVKKKK
jgi:hypothetical protein